MSTIARLSKSGKATESPEKNIEGEDDGHDATEGGGRVRKRRLDVNPNLILSDGRSKRRKSPTPEMGGGKGEDEDGLHDPKDPLRAQQLGNIIYGKIMGMVTPGYVLFVATGD